MGLDKVLGHLMLAGIELAAWSSQSLALALGSQSLRDAPVGVGESQGPQRDLGQAEALAAKGQRDAELLARALREERQAAAQAWAPLLRAWPALVRAEAEGSLPTSTALWPLWRLGLEAWLQQTGLHWEGDIGQQLPFDPQRHEGVDLPNGTPVRVITPALLLDQQLLWRAAVQPWEASAPPLG